MKENKLVAILTNILLAVLLVFFIIFSIGRMTLTKKSMQEIVTQNINTTEIIQDKVKMILEKVEIPYEIMNNINNYKVDFDYLIDKIIDSTYLYINGNNKDYSYISNDIENIIHKMVLDYETENVEEIWKYIESDVKEETLNIQKEIEFSEIPNILKQINNVMYGNLYYIILALIIICILIEILFGKVKAIFYLGVTFIGLALIIYYYVFTANNQIDVRMLNFDNLTLIAFPSMFSLLEKVYVINFIIGVILLIIYFIIAKVIPTLKKARVGYYNNFY